MEEKCFYSSGKYLKYLNSNMDSKGKLDNKGKLDRNADKKHTHFLGILHKFKNCWTVPFQVLELS